MSPEITLYIFSTFSFWILNKACSFTNMLKNIKNKVIFRKLQTWKKGEDFKYPVHFIFGKIL